MSQYSSSESMHFFVSKKVYRQDSSSASMGISALLFRKTETLFCLAQQLHFVISIL